MIDIKNSTISLFQNYIIVNINQNHNPFFNWKSTITNTELAYFASSYKSQFIYALRYSGALTGPYAHTNSYYLMRPALTYCNLSV